VEDADLGHLLELVGRDGLAALDQAEDGVAGVGEAGGLTRASAYSTVRIVRSVRFGRNMETTAQTATAVSARRGFDSLQDETRIDSLPVHGQLPPWLQGSLIRTGPAKWEVGGRSMNHWFDGLAMLHRFSFSDGTVFVCQPVPRDAGLPRGAGARPDLLFGVPPIHAARCSSG